MGSIKFYIDTSAIVKHYWEEVGSNFVDVLYSYAMKNSSRLYTAAHTITEVASSTMLSQRIGRFTIEEAMSYLNAFKNESEDMLNIIDLDRKIVHKSFRLAVRYPLKAADALHLSCATEIALEIGYQRFHFICDDVRLCTAAESEGMKVLKPSEPQAMQYFESLL